GARGLPRRRTLPDVVRASPASGRRSAVRRGDRVGDPAGARLRDPRTAGAPVGRRTGCARGVRLAGRGGDARSRLDGGRARVGRAAPGSRDARSGASAALQRLLRLDVGQVPHRGSPHTVNVAPYEGPPSRSPPATARVSATW